MTKLFKLLLLNWVNYTVTGLKVALNGPNATKPLTPNDWMDLVEFLRSINANLGVFSERAQKRLKDDDYREEITN
ncbi:unnamed protein product, partial [Mesorhabditis belari]|uniref:Uncharacterized protein n=1 Tax=Mesorhabditis belari TaxID=2138241 RepID=A0AAF3FSN4_9BILA